MTHIHIVDPEIENALIEVLRAQPGNVVVIEREIPAAVPFRSTAREAASVATPPPTSPATRLTIRDLTLNVLVEANRPLTTREVRDGVKQMRGRTNPHTVYNTLFKLGKARIIAHLPDGTWARIPR